MGNVIVVGNAPISNRGSLIDTYDIVVRLNHLKFPSYRKDCGTKIDIWAMRDYTLYPFMRNIHQLRIKELWMFNDSNGNMGPFNSTIGDQKGASTGYLAAMQAVKEFGSCDAIGFNFFTSKKPHFYDKKDSLLAMGNHDPVTEKKLMDDNPFINMIYEDE